MRQPDTCQIGANVSCGPDVIFGEHVVIGNNVTIYPKVTIGDRCRILDGSVIGRLPLSTGNTTRPLISEYSPSCIGSGCVIGCNVVLYTGITLGERVLICDLSSVREGCVLGDSVVLGRGVMVNYGTRIGNRTRIMDSAHLTGNMLIEPDVFVGMCVTTSNDNDVYLTRFGGPPGWLQGPTVRRLAVVGTGASLMPGIEVGEGAMVAVGAVVTKNVPSWTIVAGVPACHLRNVPSHWRAVALRRAAELNA